MTDEQSIAVKLWWDLTALRRQWRRFVVLGLVLVLVGSIALTSQMIASLATAMAIGGLLLFAGVVEIVGAFCNRRWSCLFLHLLLGLLSAIVGMLFIWAPIDAALALTLLLACLLMVGGISKGIAAATYQFAGCGWLLLSGIIDLILGVIILLAWPVSGLWVLGLFVGISLLFRGFNWIGLALALRGRGKQLSAAKAMSSGRDDVPPLGTSPAHAGT